MIGIVIATTLALIIGIILIIIEKNTKKKHNYIDYLPGYNCGACGYGSCKGMAEKMEEDINCYKKCRPLRGDNLKKLEDYIEKELV